MDLPRGPAGQRRLRSRPDRAVRSTLLPAVVLALALATGCGPGDEGTDAGPEEPATGASHDTPSPGGSPSMSPTTSPSDRSVREQAVADLATRLSVPESEVEVLSEEEVTWRDGSLGCAEEGMSYTQALVDGSRLVLEVDGTRYAYHSGGTRAPFLCEEPTE